MYPYIDFFGRRIGTYGMMLALAFLTVGVLAVTKARHNKLAVEDVLIVGACGVAVGLLVGKLLYLVTTYSISQLMEIIRTGKFHMIRGGIVFYGGLLGGIVGAVIGIRIADCSFVGIEKTIVPYIPLGHAIGRIGCLLAGCCYGKPYNGIFAIYYPHAVSGISPEQGCFPVQLLEVLWNILVMLFLLRLEKKLTRPTDMLSTYLCAYALGRFLLEWLRGDEYRGIYLWFSLSQWISIGILAICAVRLFCIWCRKKAPLR